MSSSKNKNLWVVPAYGIFYLIMFFILENTSVNHHTIYSPLDEKIPFCEYFIVPYLLWFVFMGATVLYFMFFNESSREYRQLVSMLGTGMTVFLIVSYVYPNCHNLRPEIIGENIFAKAVKLLYKIDTSTNLLPSIHVYNSLACFAALSRNEACRKNRKWYIGSGILTALIIMSTMFLKQHSLVDVCSAFLIFSVCYWIFYKFMPANEAYVERILSPKQVATIPNALSMVRILLAVIFWGTGVRKEFPGKHIFLMVTLALSGITDFLDGWIARKYHMISEFGKLLDPIADKVTQGVLLLYLLEKYPLIQLTLVLFLVKEMSMLLASSKLMLVTGKNEGAMWYGKVSTAVFYVVMIVLVLFPKLEYQTGNCLIGISSFFMGLSFILYMNYYAAEYRTARQKFRPAGIE